MDLKQNKLFTTKEFTFRDSGLFIKVKNLTTTQEFEIPFEEINAKKLIRISKTDNTIVLIGLVFGLIFFINLFNKLFGESDLGWGPIFILFLFTGSSALLAYIGIKRQVLIPTANNGHIEIFDGRPSKEITNAFLETLISKTNNYLKFKYGTIDKDLPIDPQLTNLMWLKDREILKDEEFEELKSKLIGRREQTNIIGFK